MASSDKFKSMHAVFEIRKGEQFHRDRHLFVEQHAVPLPHSRMQQLFTVKHQHNSAGEQSEHRRHAHKLERQYQGFRQRYRNRR